MKKIIALLVFVLGISFSVSAQELNTQENAELQAKTLTLKIKDYLNLDASKTKAVHEVIVHKNNTINNEPSLIDEKKQVLVNKFTKKLEGILTPDEFNKLKSNKHLFAEFQKF